jgi:hypothetical protein
MRTKADALNFWVQRNFIMLRQAEKPYGTDPCRADGLRSIGWTSMARSRPMRGTSIATLRSDGANR